MRVASHLLVYLFLLLIIPIACTNQQKNNIPKVDRTPPEENIFPEAFHQNTQSPIIDTTKSVTVNRLDTGQLHKIDSLGFAYQIVHDGKTTLKIDFYKFKSNKWSYHYSLDSIFSSVPDEKLEFMDFDFDGYLDARMFTGTSARGANEYFKVFLRNRNNEKFYILKDNNPPNLMPNSITQSIQSTRYLGIIGSKEIVEEYIISGDSLITIETTETWIENQWKHTLSVFYNEKGEQNSSRHDSTYYGNKEKTSY